MVSLSRRLRSLISQLDVLRRTLRARDVQLMLASPERTPFSAEGWLFEIKYDGFRVRAAKEDGRPVLLYRRGSDVTSIYPEIAAAVAELPARNVVLDGELVVLDEQGRPRFDWLQERATQRSPMRVAAAMLRRPASFFAFDLLGIEDFDLRTLPLINRKVMLRELLSRRGSVGYVDHVEANGKAFYAAVERMGLEGVVAKRRDSTYQVGRSRSWQKICAYHQARFTVVGFDRDLSAVHVAALEGHRLVYAGRAEWGFRHSLVRFPALRELLRPEPPCVGRVPRGKQLWVEPRVTCDVRFKPWLPGSLLREPIFLGFSTLAADAQAPQPS